MFQLYYGSQKEFTKTNNEINMYCKSENVTLNQLKDAKETKEKHKFI